MSGERDLETLLAAMEPVLQSGEFVFVTAPSPLEVQSMAVVREAEGITHVLRRAEADARSLRYEFVAAWITLDVHSALEAVGLTAAVATALANAGISCNAIAGYFHDHLLVPVGRADDAIAALHELRDRH